jgi:ABC-2 type transport system ATP-binding protein
LFYLQGLIDQPMRNYSHGTKQKITIIASLIHNPKLWVLDEPLTGLDPDSIYQVKQAMNHHARQGNIVLFSSHLIDLVENLCTRIVVINKGTLYSPIKVEEILKTETLEAYYLRMTVKNQTGEKQKKILLKK